MYKKILVYLRLPLRRNGMSEEFILKACKSFLRRIDTIIEKNGGHIEKIYCFVSIFLFCCLFF